MWDDVATPCLHRLCGLSEVGIGVERWKLRRQRQRRLKSSSWKMAWAWIPETPGALAAFRFDSADLVGREQRKPSAALPFSHRHLALKSGADDVIAVFQDSTLAGTSHADQGSEMGSHPCPPLIGLWPERAVCLSQTQFLHQEKGWLGVFKVKERVKSLLSLYCCSRDMSIYFPVPRRGTEVHFISFAFSLRKERT